MLLKHSKNNRNNLILELKLLFENVALLLAMFYFCRHKNVVDDSFLRIINCHYNRSYSSVG